MNLYVICSLIICLVSTFLVIHPDYEDGLVGRLALLTLSLAGAVAVGEWVDGVVYELNPTSLAIQLGLSVFLLRHVYRFNKWANGGSFDWRKNEKDTPSHDVVCPLLLGGSKTKSRRKRNPDVLKARS